jgi:hypothetical protein
MTSPMPYVAMAHEAWSSTVVPVAVQPSLQRLHARRREGHGTRAPDRGDAGPVRTTALVAAAYGGYFAPSQAILHVGCLQRCGRVPDPGKVTAQEHRDPACRCGAGSR